MKKIVFPTPSRNIKEQDVDLSYVVDRIMSNAKVRQFLQEHELTETVVLGNLGVLLRFIETNTHCDTCTSYQQCPYQPQGFHMDLELVGDQDIRIAYRRCSYQLEVETMNNNYWFRDFPEENLLLRLDDVAHTSQRSKVLEVMLQTDPKTSDGIYLYGQTGIGKTYLMIAFCNEMVHLGHTVAFTNTHKLMDLLRDYVINNKQEYQSMMDLLRNASILVLDDIGGEKITDWSKDEVIYEILHERYTNHRMTLFTSNYSMDELMELYGGNTLKNRRLYSRLKSCAKEYELIGLNYRAIKR